MVVSMILVSQRDNPQNLVASRYQKTKRKIGWILDADIGAFFYQLDWGYLKQFLDTVLDICT